MKAKIFKPVNSQVWYIQIYKNDNYLETVYCRYKYQSKLYCKENKITI